MASHGTLTITNPQVNGGTAILVYTNNIKTTIECFTNVENTPHTSATATYSSRLAKGRNTGFKNPVHNVSAVWNVRATHLTGASAVLDWEWVLELVKRSDQKMTLTCDKFATTANPAGAITVMLKSYSDTGDNSDVVRVNLSFQEVNAS